MKTKVGIPVLAAIALLAMATATNAAVLNFDYVSTTTDYASIYNGYGGFNWGNMGVIHRDYGYGSGYENGTVSGDYIAYNEYGNTAMVSDGNFSFIGAYLTAAWNTGLNINLKGYKSNALIYDQTVVVDTDAATWFNFNFNNIDRLVFNSYGGLENGQPGAFTQFAMDDFTYVIPEPASLGLIGLVAGGFVFVRRIFMV